MDDALEDAVEETEDVADEVTEVVAVELTDEDTLVVAEEVAVDDTEDVADEVADDVMDDDTDDVAVVVAVDVTVVTSHKSVLASNAAIAALSAVTTELQSFPAATKNRSPNPLSQSTSIRVPGNPPVCSVYSETSNDNESAAATASGLHTPVVVTTLRKCSVGPADGHVNTSFVYSPSRELVLSRQKVKIEFS